jgi:hypothetical protein
VSIFKYVNRMTDFHDIWHELQPAGGNPNFHDNNRAKQEAATRNVQSLLDVQ